MISRGSNLDEAARERRKTNEDFVRENISTQENNRLLNRMARVSVSSDNGEDREETRYKNKNEMCQFVTFIIIINLNIKFFAKDEKI